MAEHFNPFAGSNSGGGGGGTSERVRYTIKKFTDANSGEVTYKLMQSINSGSQTAVGEVIGLRGTQLLVNYGNQLTLLDTAIADIESLLTKTYNFKTFSELNIDTHNKTLTQITQELIQKNLPANTIVTGQLYTDALPFSGNGEAEVIINPPAYWWKCGSLNVAPYSWQAITGSSSWGDQGMVMDWTPTSYTLPTASANTLGGVKIGNGIDITDGVISVTHYVLPPATKGTIGGIIVGEGLDIDANGTLSVTVEGFTLGTVATTTGQPGTDASVTVTEDPLVSGTYNFSFTVPAGADGADGADGQNGRDGQDGQNGQDGQDGQDGVGITSITKTSSEGLVDMYTITYTNAHTSTFYVTNGANGTNGTNGADGISITGASINSSGELILTMSSGPAINAGVVKGADGTSVNIIDDLPSTSDLPSTGQHAGDCYIIDGHLWVYTGSTAPDAINGFTDAGNIRGPEGRSVVAVAVTNGDLYVTYSDDNTPVRVGPVTGPAGKGISSITKTGTVGLVDTYTVTYTDNTTFAYSISNGRSISSITKTGTSGLVDTYTIVYNDSSSSSFTVTNGDKGDTGNTGPTGNGISSIAKTGTAGLVDTYTVSYTNGNSDTFTVTNGDALRSTQIAFTLAAANWVAQLDGSYNYTYSNVQIEANSMLDIGPALGITETQLNAILGSRLTIYSISAGSVVLKAYGDVPSIDIPMLLVIEGSYQSVTPQITVDNAISDVSENPVQNKVIKGALDNKVNNSAFALLQTDVEKLMTIKEIEDQSYNLVSVGKVDVTGSHYTVIKRTDGSICVSADGSQSGSTDSVLVHVDGTFAAGEYNLTGCTGGSSSTYYLNLYSVTQEGGQDVYTKIDTSYNNEKTVTLTSDTRIAFGIVATGGITMTDQVFRPMLTPSNLSGEDFSKNANTTEVIVGSGKKALDIVFGDKVNYSCQVFITGSQGQLNGYVILNAAPSWAVSSQVLYPTEELTFDPSDNSITKTAVNMNTLLTYTWKTGRVLRLELASGLAQDKDIHVIALGY